MERKFYSKAEEGTSTFSSPVEKSSGKPTLLIAFIVLFLLAVAAATGLYFIGASAKKDTTTKTTKTVPTPKPINTPTPQASPSASVSVTPAKLTPTGAKTADLDRSDLQITILNGSGTPGAAKGISSYLNGLGYTIASVGNAQTFDYTNITVHVKKSKSAFMAQLKKDLVDNPDGASVTASIDDTIDTDAEVIVGK